MRPYLLFLLPVLFLFASCDKERIKGEGAIVTETRNISYFRSVEANGSTYVTIVPDTMYKVVVRGYQNLVPVYETRLSGNRLILEYDDNKNVRNDNITVEVHCPSSERITLNGSGQVILRPGFSGHSLVTDVNGSGRIDVQGGDFDVIDAEINGSGTVDALDATCGTAYAKITGSGDIYVYVTRYLDATIIGSGTVRYQGNPRIDTHISGSGSVRRY